jgi:hypothetical protein
MLAETVLALMALVVLVIMIHAFLKDARPRKSDKVFREGDLFSDADDVPLSSSETDVSGHAAAGHPHGHHSAPDFSAHDGGFSGHGGDFGGGGGFDGGGGHGH